MTREPKAESADEQHEPTDGLGIIVELAELPPGSLLTVNGMAQIFGKSPNTIMRAVGEGRLPRPFRIFSENCWRAGDVDVFLQRRMQDAQQRTGERPQGGKADTTPDHMAPLRRGASPIRLEPHARDT